MAFQESVDPLVEKLQFLIEDLRKNINYEEFETILKSIDEKFPFVNLLEFIEMYVNGEYSKKLIEKFHLLGYSDYYKLLQILKLNKKRTSSVKNSISRSTNLSNTVFSERYYFLQETLSKFRDSINDRASHNVLRAVIILHLFSNLGNFTNKTQIMESFPKAIIDFEHLIQSPHQQLSSLDDKKIESFVDSILLELKNSLFLEFDKIDNFRLEIHQFQLSDYIYNIIQHRKDGITYQELLISLREKLPILSQIPTAIIDITIQEFLTNNKIIKKEGYRKFKPYFDQYFTVENYKKLDSENFYSYGKNRNFFGRKISPDEFIDELIEIQKGNFEDQDDQVTRIAGMILTNSNMLTWPPNDLREFDFTVDLSRYELTKEQQELIKYWNYEIKSQIIHVKVMINENVTFDFVNKLINQLKQKGNNEQGFIISFSEIDEYVSNLLKYDRTIQIISKSALRDWCKITPVIPSRRGAVGIIRRGDNQGKIVKIKSINYESGLADIVLFPEIKDSTHYIGAIEEISLPSEFSKFIDYSNVYFQFLSKLFLISDTKIFNEIVSDNKSFLALLYSKPKIKFTPNQEMEIIIKSGGSTKIFFTDDLDKYWNSLKYRTNDLFSCSCFDWNKKSKTNGLCEHLIFALNETIKQILQSKLSKNEIEQHLRHIENRMDLFLKRLRFSSIDASVAKCPNCGQTAYTLGGVEDTFGYRQMNTGDKFSVRRQSRCKKCR